MLNPNSLDAGIVKIYRTLQSHPDELAYAFPYKSRDLWYRCYSQLQKEIENKQVNGRQILHTIEKTVDTLAWGEHKKDAKLIAKGAIYAILAYEDRALECLLSTEEDLRSLIELGQQPVHVLTLPAVQAINRARKYPRGQKYRYQETWYE